MPKFIRIHRTIDSFLKWLFSELMFGEVFGAWLIITIIMVFFRGIWVGAVSVMAYFATVILVMVLHFFASLFGSE